MIAASSFRAKPIAISVVGLVVVFGALYAVRSLRSGGAEHYAMPPLPVSTIRAEARAVPENLQVVASLQAVREVQLAPDTSGRVTAIHFESGQTVKQGGLLVELYDAPEQADRAAAVAKADFAQLQLRRSRELSPAGAESRELLEQRQADADQAVAAVRQLDARIEQKNIRAPFSGQIGIRHVNPGQYLNAGDAIATLTQADPLYVNFQLPQQDLSRLTVGASVQVSVDAVPGRVFTGKISSIEPRIDGETRNVAVQAILPNADRLLKSGMYATARLDLPAVEDGIVLPLTAIQTSASGDSVVLVRGADAQGIGKAVAVPVVTGQRLNEEVLVTQGVKAGDIVVMAGQNRLPPGAVVKINAPAAAAPTAGAK
ncbi:efflux RND transporter periplasmic adaptor subunit [Herbaspirillum rubrisubalbicans]|uniref:Efflux RND transporter periplasmic adaptor subunit n=1 Tax=Herbaspirillum rubrisubalbicans TaxID=80842 RepID=A0AAD0UCZ1_9BURK|nr:efflux RND transporter periplasmic adaptor subunit [Herbaspirillum rubrisubalbicans]ALU91547.1 acriflavin resistance lipoprotein A [Herbaspirillum rubrisubalbicans M1]AYR26521.1 efflux RND transporter periplasmic adaptor subunit [Herbaspirillum rubrisubalbicans]